jgi:hypothetical protein
LRDEGLDTVSMPNERTCREMLIPQRMGPAGSIKSDQETIPPPCSPPGHGTAPTPSHKDVVLLQQFTPFSDAACFVESTTSVKRIVAKVRSGSAPDESP